MVSEISPPDREPPPDQPLLPERADIPNLNVFSSSDTRHFFVSLLQ